MTLFVMYNSMISRSVRFLRRNMQNIIYHLIYCVFYIIIRFLFHSKKLSPIQNPFLVYKLIENLNGDRLYKNKIVMPYDDVGILDRLNIHKSYEVIEAVCIKKKSKIDIHSEASAEQIILPIAVLNQKANIEKLQTPIKIRLGNVDEEVVLHHQNRIHYLSLKPRCDSTCISIESSVAPLAIGKPISLASRSSTQVKPLIVHIFIDALPQCVFDEFGFDIMPNLYKYFTNSGTIFRNCFAQSEWTLSSLAGAFTGKYTKDHLIYHPRRYDKIADETLPYVLNKNGFRTFAVSNVPKFTPLQGFDKGFERFVVAKDKNADFIFSEVKEQINTFGPEQYIFIGLFDVHEAHNLQPISYQIENDLDDMLYSEMKRDSKDSSSLYDQPRINRFVNTITSFDKRLGEFFEYLDTVDENAVVICHSDHGIDFMTLSSELLAKERQKVFLGWKNTNPAAVDSSIKELKDIGAMLLDYLNLPHKFEYERNGYAISESLYPGKSYELAIRNKNSVLFYKVPWKDIESKKNIRQNHTFSFRLANDENADANNEHELKIMLKFAQAHFESLLNNLSKLPEV